MRTRRRTYDDEDEEDRERERERRRRHKERKYKREEEKRRLLAEEERRRWEEEHRHSQYEDTRRTKRDIRDSYSDIEYEKPQKPQKLRQRTDRRVVSGAALEEGRGNRLAGFFGKLRGGGSSAPSSEKESEYTPPPRPIPQRKKIREYRPAARINSELTTVGICAGILVVLLAIIIPVAVVVSNNNNKASLGTGPSTNNLDGKDEESIPMQWRGTYLDPFSWADTSDFNVTFADETVGDLPVMGLFDDWDDSTQANEKVPALNKAWGSYEKNPARGVNVGGWLSLEPFITPSLFNYDARYGVVDEYTLTTHLGSRKTREVLENHYATFVTESTFKEIRDAGLDHVRIPYSYWAVEVYEDDPYLFRVSWRYLLRGIEWCRKYGLRVKLDPHGIPGSQNGWNHSGRLGAINWLNGTSGAENRKRSLEFHDKISKFFAQDRYKNIIAFYGLANEPKMTELSTSDVIQWTEDAYKLVRDNGITAPVVFGDGFMGLHNWQGQMTGYDDLVLDVHQYVIFNVDQIALTHQKKVEYACDGWTKQAKESMDRSTGYGPTMFAEWSQADTDCAKHLTNVGWGNRWEGTIGSSEGESVLGPRCPTLDSKCDCGPANAKIEDMTDDYKKFLKMFAEAQMHSFENGWGWWYWTWDTEDAPLWSYKKALAGGIMPSKPWDRDFTCDSDVPSFSGLAETS